MDPLFGSAAQDLDRLYKKQFELMVAAESIRDSPELGNEQQRLSYGLREISKQIAATKLPAGLRVLMKPASYDEYVKELEKLSLLCIGCESLDRDFGKIRRMEYFCLVRQEPCILVIEDNGVCLDHKPINLTQPQPESSIIERQLTIAKYLADPKNKEN